LQGKFKFAIPSSEKLDENTEVRLNRKDGLRSGELRQGRLIRSELRHIKLK